LSASLVLLIEAALSLQSVGKGAVVRLNSPSVRRRDCGELF